MKSSCYSLFVILAGVLWGIISVFLKGLYSMGFTALQVMFFRGFISSIFMGIFLLIKDKSLLKFELKDIWMFLGTGVISLTFFSLCYFYTILESGASVAVILLYTSPIFVLIMSVLGFLLVLEEVTFSIDVNVLTSLFDVFKKAFKSPFMKSTKNFTVITPRSIKFLFFLRFIPFLKFSRASFEEILK